MRLMQAALVGVPGARARGLPEEADAAGRAGRGALAATWRLGSTTGVERRDDRADPTGTAQQQALAALKTRSVIYFDYDSSEIRRSTSTSWRRTPRTWSSIRRRASGSKDTPTNAARASTTSVLASGVHRRCVGRCCSQGAAEAQIATVSYGEERPAVAGGEESAYAQNRRVEIVDAAVVRHVARVQGSRSPPCSAVLLSSRPGATGKQQELEARRRRWSARLRPSSVQTRRWSRCSSRSRRRARTCGAARPDRRGEAPARERCVSSSATCTPTWTGGCS